MRLPVLSTIELPTERAELFARLRALVDEGACNNGYVRASSTERDLFVFFHKGATYCAGEISSERFVARTISDTLGALTPATQILFCETDLPLFLCTAVPFRKAPAASIPLSLVDPETLLRSIRETERDAVLVVRRADARSLVFCRNGEPQALYVAEAEPFPDGDSIMDRIVEYVFSHDADADITLDVYDQIQLPPAVDAGQPLSAEPSGETPLSLATPLSLLVKLGDRVVFHYPITTEKTVIGRGLEVDLALDNLSVSRRHAEARYEDGRLILTDVSDKNGLVVRGEKVERAELRPGDSVGLGKYTLELSSTGAVSSQRQPAANRPRFAAIEQTFLMAPAEDLPELTFDGKSYRLDKVVFNIGSDERAHVRISGFFVAPVHVRICRDDEGGYRVEHVAGWRSLKLNGSAIKESRLKVGDELSVGSNRLVVRHPS